VGFFWVFVVVVIFLIGEGRLFLFIRCNTEYWIGLTSSHSFTIEDPVACFGSEVSLSCCQCNSEQ